APAAERPPSPHPGAVAHRSPPHTVRRAAVMSSSSRRSIGSRSGLRSLSPSSSAMRASRAMCSWDSSSAGSGRRVAVRGMVPLLSLSLPRPTAHRTLVRLVSRFCNSLAVAPEVLEDLVGGLVPDKRTGVVVPGFGPSYEFVGELTDAVVG